MFGLSKTKPKKNIHPNPKKSKVKNLHYRQYCTRKPMWVQHEYSRNCCFFVSCAACFFPQRGSSTARSRSIVAQASFLPSFPSFFLSRCCSFLFLCGWFFRNSRVCFFFFWVFLGGCFSRAFRVSSCERLTAYRCSLTAS